MQMSGSKTKPVHLLTRERISAQQIRQQDYRGPKPLILVWLAGSAQDLLQAGRRNRFMIPSTKVQEYPEIRFPTRDSPA